MWNSFVLSILPFVGFILCWISLRNSKTVRPIPFVYILFLSVLTALAIGLWPIGIDTDKENYADLYLGFTSSLNFLSEYKDIGWLMLVRFSSIVFGQDVYAFFVFIASIYVMGYLLFAYHTFGLRYMGYFVILAFGCIGFVSYGIVTIRNGVAIAILFSCLCFNGKLWLKILLALLSVSMHKSMVIPIGAFTAAYFIRRDQYIYLIWLFCLLLSIMNVNLSSLFESVGFVDERITSYTMADTRFVDYNVGFRIDFLIYSVIPMLFVRSYVRSGWNGSRLYQRIFHTYMICNAVWLLVIRLMFTNRVAYLSWFLIPYLVLYPLVKDGKAFKKPQTKIFLAMGVFLSVSLLLSLRTYLK